MDETLKRVEEVFRGSSCSNELFDSFQEALKHSVSDIGVYKILLGNPALTSDEIKMFTEKLVKQFPQHTFETLFWTGNIFENQKEDLNRLEDSINYYKRAFLQNSFDEHTLVHLLNLYNYEMEIPANKTILDFVESEVITVNRKSRVYFCLSDLYRQKGNLLAAVRYLALGEKSAERESN
jgi:hypothetical protein